MAALFDNDVLDAALDEIRGANSLRICSGAPTTYAAAETATLASVALTAADFTAPVDGTPNGRATTVSAKADVPVLAAAGGGTKPTHYCLLDTTGSRLLAMTEVNSASPNLSSGSTTDIPAVTFSIADPTVV